MQIIAEGGFSSTIVETNLVSITYISVNIPPKWSCMCTFFIPIHYKVTSKGTKYVIVFLNIYLPLCIPYCLKSYVKPFFQYIKN